jgi:hypothetical protein
MCGNKLFSLRDFQDYMFEKAARRLEEKLEIIRKTSAGMMLRLIEDPAKTSLWSLIKETSHLHCVDPRDKAYAVLNIAQTGSQGMAADYTVTLPVLLNRILRTMHDSLPQSPQTLLQVAKQCAELERTFGEPVNSMFTTNGSMDSYPHGSPLEQLARQGCHPDLRVQQQMSEWCDFYSHFRVRGLVIPDLRRCQSDNSRRLKVYGSAVVHTYADVGIQE